MKGGILFIGIFAILIFSTSFVSAGFFDKISDAFQNFVETIKSFIYPESSSTSTDQGTTIMQTSEIQTPSAPTSTPSGTLETYSLANYDRCYEELPIIYLRCLDNCDGGSGTEACYNSCGCASYEFPVSSTSSEPIPAPSILLGAYSTENYNICSGGDADMHDCLEVWCWDSSSVSNNEDCYYYCECDKLTWGSASSTSPIPLPTCTDSDGGAEIYTLGKTSVGENSYFDYCSSGNILSEAVCGANGQAEWSSMTCQAGCLNGVCFKEPTITSAEAFPKEGPAGSVFTINVGISNKESLKTNPIAVVTSINGVSFSIPLFDDGIHGDAGNGNGIYGNNYVSSLGTDTGDYSAEIKFEGIIGGEKTFSVQKIFSVLEDECVAFVKNGENSKKINLVFVPDGYITNEELENFKSVILPKYIGMNPNETGIFSREPFKTNMDRFNIYYINENNSFGYDSSSVNINIATERVAKYCPFFDSIIVVVKDYLSGYAYTGYNFAVVPGGRPDISGLFEEKITSHEFGHSFGGLKDEYTNIFPVSATNFPNCDTYGCSKWCTGTPIKPAPQWEKCASLNNDQQGCSNNPDCIWNSAFSTHCMLKSSELGDFSEGLNCVEGTGCYHNCRGTNGFRSSLSSIMRYPQNADSFNIVSINHLAALFKCCYPQISGEFDDVFCTQWNTNNFNRYNSCLSTNRGVA
jgi:hypothetical protein